MNGEKSYACELKLKNVSPSQVPEPLIPSDRCNDL